MITVAPLAYGFKLGGLQSPNQQQLLPPPKRSDAVTDQTEFSASATNPLPSPLPQEREQSAAAVSDSLKAAAAQTESSLPSADPARANPTATCPFPWRVGERAQSSCRSNRISRICNKPFPSPLPQEREQAAAVSDDLKPKQLCIPSQIICTGKNPRQHLLPSPWGGLGEAKQLPLAIRN